MVGGGGAGGGVKGFFVRLRAHTRTPCIHEHENVWKIIQIHILFDVNHVCPTRGHSCKLCVSYKKQRINLGDFYHERPANRLWSFAIKCWTPLL